VTFNIPRLQLGQAERSLAKRENTKQTLLKFFVLKNIA